MSKNKKNYKLFRPKKRYNKEFVNKMIKRDISLYLVMILSIIFLASTSTYAYLTTSQTEELEDIVSSNIEGVTIENNNINIENLDPNSNYMYEFTVDNSNTEVAKNITYYLKITKNTFSNLKFKVYEGTKDTVSNKTPLYASNKLSPSINEVEITGLEEYIKANETQTYTIVFNIEKVDNQEIYDAYKEFNANIFIDLKTTGNVGE